MRDNCHQVLVIKSVVLLDLQVKSHRHCSSAHIKMLFLCNLLANHVVKDGFSHCVHISFFPFSISCASLSPAVINAIKNFFSLGTFSVPSMPNWLQTILEIRIAENMCTSSPINSAHSAGCNDLVNHHASSMYHHILVHCVHDSFFCFPLAAEVLESRKDPCIRWKMRSHSIRSTTMKNLLTQRINAYHDITNSPISAHMRNMQMR